METIKVDIDGEMKYLIPPELARKYYLHSKLKKTRLIINSRKKRVEMYFSDFSIYLGNKYLIELVKKYEYKLVESRQLKMDI